MATEKGWAIVTGASSGIGLAFARALALRGHPVLAVARRKERLEDLQKEVVAKGGRLEPFAQDLAAPGACEAVVKRADELGPIDLLVNNAGLGHHGHFEQLPLDGAISTIRLNVEVLVDLTRRVLPSLVSRKSGGIINVASTAAFQPVPWMATYGATKAFVLSFTEAVASELSGSGVRLLAICPGATESEFADIGGAHTIIARSPVLATSAEVVATALSAYDAGRVVKVEGFLNWLGTVLSKISPRAFVRWAANRLFKPVAAKA